MNVTANIIYDSGRVTDAQYLKVQLLASGGNISDSVLEFSENHMIISEIDRYDTYANQYYQGSSFLPTFLDIETQMFLDHSMVNIKGNTAFCAEGEKCDFEKLSWGLMFGFSSWEMHSGTSVTVANNTAELAATGVRLILGSVNC